MRLPLALLLSLWIPAWSTAEGVLTRADVRVGDTRLLVEIADEEHERRQGLMFRRSLPDGQGMLFVYPDSRPLAFWMKNTPLPLDIAFIDSSGIVTQIAPLEPFSERVVHSNAPAMYALEVPRGWYGSNGIVPGARLVIGLTRP